MQATVWADAFGARVPDKIHPPASLRSTLWTETSLPGDPCVFETVTIPAALSSFSIVAPQGLRQNLREQSDTKRCRARLTDVKAGRKQSDKVRDIAVAGNKNASRRTGNGQGTSVGSPELRDDKRRRADRHPYLAPVSGGQAGVQAQAGCQSALSGFLYPGAAAGRLRDGVAPQSPHRARALSWGSPDHRRCKAA